MPWQYKYRLDVFSTQPRLRLLDKSFFEFAGQMDTLLRLRRPKRLRAIPRRFPQLLDQ